MSAARIGSRFVLCLAALMALSPFCGAHEVVPPDWCIQDKKEPKIVANYNFDGKELRTLMAKCGIVEGPDHWQSVTKTLIAHCDIVAPNQDALPFVFGPNSYLAKEHHTHYQIDEGVRGACAICVSKKSK